MFVEPERTPYDLNFRLLGFPVRIHPLFWLGAALLGASWFSVGPLYLLIWIAVVFVSLLVHELGHAVAFRWFGVDSHVVLYLFYGLAVPWSHVRARWQRIVVSLAGPGAGFLLLAVVYYSNEYFPWASLDNPRENPRVWVLYQCLFSVNLWWGVFNLLPVYPLDGGRVSEEVCTAVSPRNGPRVALQISIGVAALVALYSLACALDPGGHLLSGLPDWLPRGSLWTAILFGMLAVQNYQLLQQVRWTQAHWQEDDDRPPWRS